MIRILRRIRSLLFKYEYVKTAKAKRKLKELVVGIKAF